MRFYYSKLASVILVIYLIFCYQTADFEVYKQNKGIDRWLTPRIISYRDQAREAMRERIENLYAYPGNQLMLGLITGDDSKIPNDLKNQFRQTGTSHLTAVSGFNMSLILLLFVGQVKKLYLNRKIIYLLSTFVLLFYGIIVEFGSSVARAVLMSWLIIYACAKGRAVNSALLILSTGAFLTTVFPGSIRYDIGFQLSFAATIGLMFVASNISDWLEDKKVSSKVLLEYIIPSVVAYIFTLPIIYLNFNQLTLITPVVNIILAPLVPFTTVLGMIILGLDLLYHPLAQIIGYSEDVLLSIIIWIVQFFAHL